MNTSALSLDDLWKKIDDVKVGMFTTVDTSGQVTSRPMRTRELDTDGILWFFASLHSELTRELTETPLVNITFSEPKDSFYSSLSGRATLIQDRALYAKLWRPLDKAWFSCGVDDPNLVLIRFDADLVEYWDSASSRMVQLLKMAKATITGSNVSADLGTHGSIKL